jgi:hypothetical protein
MNVKRLDHEPPPVISQYNWKYHHIGIPTDENMPGEKYIPHLKMYVAGFESSPFGIEWMRFEEGCSLDPLIQQVPHVAFEVENLEDILNRYDFEVLSHVNSPSDGVNVAMVKHNGAPVELIEFVESNT